MTGYPKALSPATEGYIERAEDFVSRGMWEAAADQIQTILTRGDIIDDTQVSRIAFILGNAYSHTDNPRCLELLDNFIIRNPSSPLLPQALMAKGDFLFFAQRYPEACEVYSGITNSSLPVEMRSAETYRYALSMIKSGLISEARPLMESLANNSEYAEAALFYDAYIDYAEKKYKEAYDKFSLLYTRDEGKSGRRIAQRTDYIPTGLEAGYYIVQLDYLRGEYQKAIDNGLSLMQKTPVPMLMSETLRAVGLSYFKLGETEEAYPLLRSYIDETGEEAYYEARYALATILYSRGDTEESAALFGELTQYDDAIGQSALVYLGQIAAGKGDDSAAAIAFEKATRMNCDKAVSQAALYNYVVARTRGGNIPFNTSVDLLERYISLYPNSRQAPMVDEYLATTYYSNNDFESALRSIDRIANPGTSVKKIKQKILYELGMQQLIKGESSAAISSLRQAIELKNINPGLLAQAEIWLGDACYAEGRYNEAINAYTSAIKQNPGINRGLALYGKGYALCGLNRFGEALTLFSEAASDKNLSSVLRADARLRMADCKLYEGEMASARDLYATIASSKDAGADYAAWRYASILGLQHDTNGKIDQLERLAKNPDSRWTPDILIDLARSYLDSRNDTDAALPLLQRLIKDFPNTTQASTANDALRSIYAERGELKAYSDFLVSVSSPFSLDKDEAEMLTFTSASEIFNNSGKVERLEKYVEEFPSGPNVAEAHYMIARGYENAGDSKHALEHYRALEKSNAGEYLNIARIGIMRNATDPREQLEYASIISASGGHNASLHQEAQFIMAKALKETGNSVKAEEIWQELASNPSDLYGARSAVTLAQHLLESGNLTKAEKILDNFIDSSTPHAYWLARGYIVLSDVLSNQGKKYIARQYLESLRDNYPGNEVDIKDMITKRLKKL